jgi:hypothetical protein
MALASDQFLSYWEEKPSLWAAIYTFNIAPATYIHPSHWPAGLLSYSIEAILKDPKAEASLSQWILEEHKLKGEFLSDFEAEYRRIALLEPKTLQKLFLFMGTALNHERIAKILSKNERQILESQLGADAYRFGLKQAPLMIGPKAPWMPIISNEKPLFEIVLESALQAFQMVFAQAEYGIKKRIELKLPSALQWQWNPSVPDATIASAFRFTKRILTKISEPKALTLI